MILRVPDYYDEFACIARRCKGSCCAGWEIDIDDPAREYYEGVSGTIGDRLREKMYMGEDGGCRFRLSEEGRCPFLNDENLCDIIIALGPEALSEVCTDFPRFSLSYGNVTQRVLSISCEEVGRILFSRREKVSWHEVECPDVLPEQSDLAKGNASDEALQSYIEFLERVQTLAVARLQDRSRGLSERVASFLAVCEQAQEVINDWSDMEHLLDECLDTPRQAVDQSLSDEWKPGGTWYSSFDFRFGLLEDLEELGVEWANEKRRVRSVLTGERYDALRAEYLASEDYDEIAYEQLLVYFSFRYLMQAVYSYDLLSYGRMAVSFTLMIRDLDICRWSENGKKIGLDDRIDTAHIFSREVEHSEENFEQLREELMFSFI